MLSQLNLTIWVDSMKNLLHETQNSTQLKSTQNLSRQFLHSTEKNDGWSEFIVKHRKQEIKQQTVKAPARRKKQR